MSRCSQCGKDSGHDSYAFCTECGSKLDLALSELPTLGRAKKTVKKKAPAGRSVEDENLTLRKEIERLKETSAVLFGATEETASKRVSRILAVSGFERNLIGKVEKGFIDKENEVAYNTTYLPSSLDDFLFYRATAANDLDQDSVMYVAIYRKPVDLEKELADIRQLIAHCDLQRLEATFVMATNEDLQEHKAKVQLHFKEIRMTVPPSRRAGFRLEIWDQKELTKLEHKLKIRVQPKQKARGPRMGSS